VATPNLQIVVPRDPLIEPLNRADVLGSYVLRDRKAACWSCEAAMQSATDPKYDRWVAGDLLVKVNGVAFLTLGHADHPFTKSATGVGEFVLHMAAHEVVGGVLSLAGGAALSVVQGEADRRRMLKELQSPATLAIPGTDIVDVRDAGDADLTITAQDTAGHLEQYRFRDRGTVDAEMIWRMRLRLELWWYIAAVTAVALTQQQRDQKDIRRFADGWFANAADQRFVDDMDALFKPLGLSWRDVMFEAYYHVQRFRVVPALVEGKVFWEALDRSDYQPLCFSCGKAVPAKKPLFCPFCGSQLTSKVS